MPDRANRLNLRGALVIATVVLGAGTLLWWAGADLWHPHELKIRVAALLESAGPWAPAVYVLFYAFAPFLLVGAIPMTIAGGALFGAVEGCVLSLAGATLGAAVAFLLGRQLGHDFLTRHAHGKLLAVKAGIEKEGWRFVAFLRLVPLLPFGVANALVGTTDIGFAPFLITSFVAMVPGAAIYAYLGAAGRAAAAGDDGTAKKVGIALGLLALLSGVPAAIRYARYRREQDRATEASPVAPSIPAPAPSETRKDLS